MKNIVIIGAGASGLVCAVEIAKQHRDVEITLIDKQKIPGKKLLSTGNGRCNLSNKQMSINNYHGDINTFYPIVDSFDCEGYFKSLGLLTRYIDDLLYPYSLQAKTVQKLFMNYIQKYKIKTYYGHQVESISSLGDRIQVGTNQKISIIADYLVLATGGIAGLNNDKAGYDLLNPLNYRLVSLRPSLVQIKTNPCLKQLKGTRVKSAVTLYKDNQKIREEVGEVLFTDYGLSGICIFQLTSMLQNNQVDNYKISIDLFPDFKNQQLANQLKQNINRFNGNAVNMFEGIMPISLAEVLPKHLNIKKISFDNCMHVAKQLKALSFSIVETLPFKNAQVTKGGISKNDVTETLSLKNHPNIYACGELLNLDGDCGGYNLHFAFASGYHVAKSISKQLSSNT